MLSRLGVQEHRGDRDEGSSQAHSRPLPPAALVPKGRRSITSTVGSRPTTPLCQAVGANRAEPLSARSGPLCSLLIRGSPEKRPQQQPRASHLRQSLCSRGVLESPCQSEGCPDPLRRSSAEKQ